VRRLAGDAGRYRPFCLEMVCLTALGREKNKASKTAPSTDDLTALFSLVPNAEAEPRSELMEIASV
jgi:hypothetical protein